MVSILDGQKLISVAEAAEILGCCRRVVYVYSRWPEGKRLETALVGNRIKTTLENCQNFLRQRDGVHEPVQPVIVTASNGHAQAMRDLQLL